MTNILGTVSAIITVVLAVMTNVLGCSLDAAGATVCTSSWLTPMWAGVAMASFAVLTLIAKMMRPGGTLHSLFGATAVVVPEGQGSPGVVTPTQVKSPT